MCLSRYSELMQAGASATAELLDRVYGVSTEKVGKLNPLVDKDFVTLAARLSRALKRSAGSVNEDDLIAATKDLEVDWKELTPMQREDRYKKLRAAILALALLSIPATQKVLAEQISVIVRDTKTATILEGGLDIPAGPSEQDEKSAAFLVSVQDGFTESEYERRAATIEEMVREMVDSGLESGLESAVIAALVIRAVQVYSSARDDAYWAVTANALANRARTVTQLNAFAEAGVSRVRFVAVMDGVTCVTCEFMNGREASVEALSGAQRKTEALVEPEDILGAQPWLLHDAGGMYYKRGGVRHDVGEDVSTEELVAEGLFLTPIHGRCRCKIEAVASAQP
jgi:hypothetical protein